MSKEKLSLLMLRVRELHRQHGTLRAVGLVLGLDHAYLKRLEDGTKINPSSEVLRKLHLRKVIGYERTNT